MELDNKAVIQNPVTMEDLMQLFTQLNSKKSSTETQNFQPIQIPEKLNHKNFTKWAKLMQLELGGRGRLNHITASPPSQEDPDYTKWSQRDSLVISWIIGNIDPELQNQFLDYPTSRDLWKGIELLYGGTKDGLQIFDLMVKANKIQQGRDPIEIYYSKLTGVWKEIDRRSPNPMNSPEDKTTYNQITQQNRLYQFLAGVDETLDKDRWDILNREPLPTPEEAFAIIRREINRRGIMSTEPPKPSQIESSGIGGGFTVRGRTEKPNFRRDDEKSGLRCTHCGGARHTKKGCFEIIGYPEWWGDRKKRGEKKSMAAVGTSEAPVTGGEHGGTEAGCGASLSASGMTEKAKEEGMPFGLQESNLYGPIVCPNSTRKPKCSSPFCFKPNTNSIA
ncbi:uncharacterized protein LOC130797733 isoform X1 [Amaranthus tricolor]|uniref:uncharacterized protein LOC130797733 isoform X1 n=1 Tax=Amaranthus tricolor TaxID=29722 RepID=UPI00258D4196|nr:uncharacterized protein LOC130797733 isoform X1 [Amaranthus tricolor]